MDQILNKLAEVSKTTPENVKKLTEDPILAKLYKASGNNPAVLNGPGGYKGTLTPLEISASTIDLTNTYTDPIESYMSYGVPLNPFVDWNEERAKRQSTLEKWGHGLTKAGITGLTAVAENTLGTVAGLINLAFGENHSFYDNPVGRAMDDINEWAREAMPNYYTKAEQRSSVVGDGWGTGLLSANFWADKVAGGAAYTMGSIASMFLGTGEAALIGRLGNMGRASKFAKVLDVAADTEKALEKGSRTLNNYRTAKIITGKVGKSADEVAKGTERLAKMANINTGAKQLTVATQMSLAEANMEARETKNRFIEEQTAKWEEANPGQEMPEDIRKGIEESAYAAGNMAFGLNMAVLAPTNILMFGKMFKGGKPLGEALINKVEKQGTGLGAKWIESQGATKFSRALNKSNRIFGKPLENMLTESFQEGAQFLSAEASRIYYDDKFADGTGDLAGAFSQGLSKTFGSKEGIENMLIGALIGGGTGTISRLAGADKKLQATKDANTKKALDILNSGSFAKVLENMENNDINKRIVNEMDKAVKAGDMITADRYRMRLISNVADQYRKIGALDAAVEQLEDLKELDEKEFISRWGYDTTKTLKEQTGKTQIEIIDEVKNKIETYSKVRENIDTILRAQQPEKAIIPRVVDALFDTDAIKKSKALETSVRAMYGNMLLNRVVDLDSIDDNIDKIYDELVQLSPALGKLSKEDFSFQVKVGDIKLDDEGKFVLSPSNKAVTTSKATEEFLKVANAYKEINRPDIANEIQYKMASLNALIKDREVARTSYERFIAKPGELADSIIADILDAPRKAREQANATAAQALQNAQSTDELATAFPDNTDDDLKLQAMARMDELEALETPIYNSYMDMSDEEFAGIKIDDLDPLQEAAYKRAVRTRAEKAAELRQSKNIEFQSPEADQAAEAAAASYQDVLSDMEARTFGEIMVSYDGGSVNIDGRTYHNLEDNPLDAIIRNEKGDIIGFILTDLSTGNKITWNKTEVQIDPQTGQVSPEYERADRDNAIVDGLSYMTLLQAASIRPDQTIPAADAKEELAPRIQAITEEFEKKEAFENNQGATEAERELANKGLDKNEGLTDIQLRAQIETLKEDLAELNEVIYISKMIAVEAGLTMQEFYDDSEVKSLTQKRKKVTERILRKINVLRARKQQVRNEVIPNSTNEAELAVPTEDESNFIAAGLNEEIKKLQDEKEYLVKSLKTYEDVLDGKYETAENPQAAREARKSTVRQAIKELKKKIAVVDSKINKRNNQINRINEERELEKLRQERDAAEGTGTAPQGEEPQGKDIDSREGVEETRVDGILDDKEAERLREQAEEAAKKFKEEQERQKNAPADTSTPSVVTTQVKPTPVIKEEGAVKVQLTKGEVGTNPEFKVLVSTEGLSMSNDLVAQFVDGKPIVTQPGQLTKPEVAAPGTMVRFEVAENTDWWQTQTPTPGEEWKTVPIYVIATDAAGNEIRVGMLQANGESREDIYSLYKQGFTPVAMVERKLFDGTNVRNSRVQTPTGEQTFFYPASTLGNAGEAPQIVYVGAEYGNKFSKTWKMMNSPSGAVDPETHFPLQNQENITHGQVGIVVRRPDGSYGVVMASTRDMTEEGRQAAISTVTAETPDLVAFSNIVGVNKLTNEAEVADNAESDVVSILDDDSVGELGQFRESFMMVESLLTGAQLITFYSESSKQLVRMNANELKATLLGAIGRFSFVEATTDEDGKTRMKVVSKENKDEYKAVAANLKADFEKIIMKKKFQVSKERLTNDTSPFVSPINGVTYPSYFAFLTSEDALGTPREGSVGSNAILAVDVSKNEHGHVFYDVGLSLNNLGTIEGDTTTQRELDANSIPFPKPPAAPAPTDVITDQDYNNFVDNNVVSDVILNSIADKVINRASLSQRETAIFSGKTSEINEIIRNKATAPSAPTAGTKADIERRRQEDRDRPARESVMYKLRNKIAGIDNPKPGNEIPTLSEAIKIAGAKLSSPIKINEGEITHVVFDQEESTFRFTYKGKQFAAFYIESARGITRWEIAKLNDRTGTYQSISLDELKNINEKYGSQKDLLISLGVKDLVEDIENFEKVEYSKEDKSSANGIIPLENTVSAEQVRLGKKYGVTYTLEDFLKEYDAELAALGQPSAPAVTQPAANSDIVTVYHHTPVSPKDFDFGNFQRGKNAVSQFGDGLNASSTTTPFLVQRYGNPIEGEINDSDFIVIDANKSEKELYEELKAKGYKFNNPATGSYIGNNPAKEYDGTEKANIHPAIISLFNDFQQSNPEVKGVKVINHIIGGQKVDPFYVIYDAKSFYGPGSLQAPTTPAPSAPVTPQAPAAPVSESEILEVPSGPMEGSGIFAFMQPTAQPVVVPSSPLDEGAKQGSITDLGDFMSRFKVPEGFNPGVSVNDVAPNVQDAIGEKINQNCKE